MNNIQKYKIFESHINKKKEIRILFKSIGFNVNQHYKINDNLSVDVYNGIALVPAFVSNGMLIVDFNYINGHFNCSNLDLTSLKNMPKMIDGNFNCSLNSLKSLDGINCRDGIYCSQNKITSITPEVFNKVHDFRSNPIFYFLNHLVAWGFPDDNNILIERIDEFEVIDGNIIDIINLEKMFIFYQNVIEKKIGKHNHLNQFIHATKNHSRLKDYTIK